MIFFLWNKKKTINVNFIRDNEKEIPLKVFHILIIILWSFIYFILVLLNSSIYPSKFNKICRCPYLYRIILLTNNKHFYSPLCLKSFLFALIHQTDSLIKDIKSLFRSTIRINTKESDSFKLEFITNLRAYFHLIYKILINSLPKMLLWTLALVLTIREFGFIEDFQSASSLGL